MKSNNGGCCGVDGLLLCFLLFFPLFFLSRTNVVVLSGIFGNTACWLQFDAMDTGHLELESWVGFFGKAIISCRFVCHPVICKILVVTSVCRLAVRGIKE